MLWLSSYIQNWQMTKIDHLPTKLKLLHFTSSTPTIDVEPKKPPGINPAVCVTSSGLDYKVISSSMNGTITPS